VAMFLTARVANKNIEQERNEIMKWMKVEGLSALVIPHWEIQRES